ncbi:efflux RND transporter periplasmic adaptor subunit [Vibrio lentus]|uniref:Uncharacterized protein n=1 Tax=Vibrio lentus TaxID=136468 RepID=A0A2N7K911_9VIBR|nr:efflux RND transporter periplasmic adaptor subunit [Vibrio lentus]PMM71347.1 hypothetical protein BCT49_04045 [Vibrio lentus]
MKYIALFVFSFVLTGCKQQSATPDLDTTKPIRSVKYITTVFQSHTQIRELSGIVQSAQTSPLSFKVGGTVSDLIVSKGQHVEKGQVLAQLETHDLVFALQKARASLGAAKVAKLQAEDKYKRSAKLSTKGFVSESELIAIRADLDANQQQENLAQTDLSNAELNLERAKLYAPFSGQVSQVSIDEFTKVSSGQKIIELVNDFAYEVDFLVPESLISEIYFGEEAKVKVPALNDATLTGTVSEIGAVVERGNAYSVTLQLSESKVELRNGMSAEIQFNIGSTNHGAVLLPIDSFNFNDRNASSEKNNAAIFVVNPESLAIEKRYVEIKRSINTQVVVIGNLLEGEHVVTAGIPYLYEGQQVTLWEGL